MVPSDSDGSSKQSNDVRECLDSKVAVVHLILVPLILQEHIHCRHTGLNMWLSHTIAEAIIVRSGSVGATS